LGFNISISQATVHEFDIFSQNGQYSNDPCVDITVDVTSSEASTVDFAFFNNSIVQSSVAMIYFDDGTLLGIDHITNGPGVKFSKNYSGPADLINGASIGFYADVEFIIGTKSPPPKNGINESGVGKCYYHFRFEK
jgi:hypothetical protein